MHGVIFKGGTAASLPVSLLANPVHFSRAPKAHDRAPPAPGAHTAEILRQRLDSFGTE